MAIKELTISAVEQQDERLPIFAVNNSKRSSVGEAGDLIIGIPKLNGSSVDSLRIDQTWLPIELTGQIPRTQLLNSSEFRRAVTDGLIILISEEQAAKINAREGAADEKLKLRAFREQVKVGGAARTISDANVEIRGQDGKVERDDDTIEINSSQDIGVEATAEGLEPKFKMWADRLESRADLDCKNEILSQKSLKKREIRYLISVLKTKPKTCAWLKGKIK